MQCYIWIVVYTLESRLSGFDGTTAFLDVQNFG